MTMSTVGRTGGTGGTVCPECSAPVKVRLIGGEACPQCESSKAWERYGGDGHKLVIHKRDIAGAEARITGQADGSAATARYWLPGLLALGVGIGASFFVRELFSARPLGPLEPLVAELQRTSLMSAGLGVVALAVGIASTLAQKKGSLFRNATLLIVNLSAVLVGAFTMLVGAFQWGNWGGASGVGWAHMAMPPLAGALSTTQAITAQEKSIMSATTVLVAPDGNGDARGMSLGSGAVIRSDSGAAFVVTCSHVAMPYASVAALSRRKAVSSSESVPWVTTIPESSGSSWKSSLTRFAMPNCSSGVMRELPIAMKSSTLSSATLASAGFSSLSSAADSEPARPPAIVPPVAIKRTFGSLEAETLEAHRMSAHKIR